MADVTLTIDGVTVTVPEGATIMEAADKAGIHIPRLCYHPELSIAGACRVCIVEVEGMRNLPASCSYPAAEGMVVRSHSPEVLRLRRDIVELLVDNHPMDCNTCERDGNCELQRLANAMGIRERLFAGDRKRYAKDLTGPSITRDPEKCILCGRCVRMCGEVQEVAALGQVNRGFDTVVMPAHDAPAVDTVCTGCGQCINVCPTAAFLESDATSELMAAIEDPDKIVVAQMAPSVRAAIGECFGLEPGKAWEGECFAAMRRMGIDVVFDTQFAADLTIMEEAAEFVERFKSGHLPNITSCCPTWVKYCEQFHPDMMQYLSSAKSPMSMQGAVTKTYWAEKMGIDPHRIFSVAFMCCTCKKFEAERRELFVEGMPAVDKVCTTREFGWLMKHMGIDFLNLQPEEPDNPIGSSSGAGVIFGATGGVTEAALRTAYWMLFDEELPDDGIDFYETRGIDGVREAWLDLKGNKVHIAIASGLGSANKLLDRLRAGEEFHWIEIMGCPGGCIGGGGQPYAGANAIPLDKEALRKRASALYNLDAERTIRKSHLNPDIQRLYEEYLGKPMSEKAHHLLHTHYHARLPVGIRPQEAQHE
ncbi:MAG: NADH-dependent [FeFe] hydrogenase, group A6 [Acidobacteriota bacterium]|nr:NADH-dependent [FeFe] hydrogenase, group A6 [Acidobacteriota bacterium]